MKACNVASNNQVILFLSVLGCAAPNFEKKAKAKTKFY